MKRALMALTVLACSAMAPVAAFAQAATPLPPPPPPPPGDPSTAPTVVPARPAAPPPQYAPASHGQGQGQGQPAFEPGEERKIRKAENAVFLELGGNGLVYSINYERIFGDSDFSVRVGLSYISLSASNSSTSAKLNLVTVPVLGNYYVGGRDHKLQLGAGLTFFYASGNTGSNDGLVSFSGLVPAPTVAIGYRYLPAKGGFTFFIGFTPFIIPGNNKIVQPWAGMSFGGAF